MSMHRINGKVRYSRREEQDVKIGRETGIERERGVGRKMKWYSLACHHNNKV